MQIVGKNKTNDFRFVLDKFANRIKRQSKRLLLRWGKEVFSKAVLQSLPTYHFSMFLLLRGIIERLKAKARSFWWESKNKYHERVMLRWDMVCTPKGMGGLEFKDLRLFNIALLGKQLWRLVNNKETLCYHVLSSKYFPDGDLFNPKILISPLMFGLVFARLLVPSRLGLVGKLAMGGVFSFITRDEDSKA